MRLNRLCILLLWIMAGGAHARGQDEDSNARLSIYDQPKSVEICTPEDIEAFYSILDDVQAQVDNIVKITNTMKLQIWVSVNNTWTTKVLTPHFRNSCDGVRHLYLQLEHSLKQQITNQMFLSEGEIPQDDIIAGIRALLDADLAAIDAGEVSEGKLQINRIVTSRRDCTLEEALLFSESIDEYENATFILFSIPRADWLAVAEWSEGFETWAEDAWSTLHEQPCGETITLIYWLETIAYGLPIDWVYYGVGYDTLDSALSFMRDRDKVDLELVKERSRDED